MIDLIHQSIELVHDFDVDVNAIIVIDVSLFHSNHSGEMSSSADSPATASALALQQLANNCWCDLVRLSAYIVTLLEYLDYMPLPQVKRIMELLAKLAYGFSPTDESKTMYSNNIFKYFSY